MTETLKPKAEKLLVCVSAHPSSTPLIYAAKRRADSRKAKWLAVYVEEPRMAMRPEAERQRAMANLRLAEQLGGEVFTLQGRDIAATIVDFAREQNITQIVVGKPRQSWWRSVPFGNPVDHLLRLSGEIDVLVTTGEPGEPAKKIGVIRGERTPWSAYGRGILYLVLATLVGFAMYPRLHLSNLIMVYLLAVMVTAIDCGRGPAILISALSVLAFDFCFVPPRFSLTVGEGQYIVTFLVMFLVALVISHLATRVQQQAETARIQERQATAMHGLSRQLASARGIEKILQVALQYLAEIFDCRVVALLPDEAGRLKVGAGDLASVLYQGVEKELPVAHSAYDTGRMTGWGTATASGEEILYVPLQADNTTLGVLALRPEDPQHLLPAERLELLESLAKQVALALEVEVLTEKKG